MYCQRTICGALGDRALPPEYADSIAKPPRGNQAWENEITVRTKLRRGGHGVTALPAMQRGRVGARFGVMRRDAGKDGCDPISHVALFAERPGGTGKKVKDREIDVATGFSGGSLPRIRGRPS